MGLSFEQEFYKDPKRMLKLEDIRLDLICKPFQSKAFEVFRHLHSYEKLVILCSLGHFKNYPKHILWLFYYCQIRYRITRMFSTKKTRHYKHLDFTVQIRVDFHSILGQHIFKHLTKCL
ncbi:hypothetical protein AMTRI_Chr06g197220 [Amborella trichopoda]